MPSKFNLNQLLNGASVNKPDTLKVVPISVYSLVPSDDNFYSVDNLAEIKMSIEMFGVMQNLTVRPCDNGRYTIISGHRRYLACLALAGEGKKEFEFLPCAIEPDRDEVMDKILLIMANSTARELSDFEKTKQAGELRKHFETLKKRDGLPGRVRDLVAAALKVSSTQVARMDAISNNLEPELKDEFRAGNLGISAAYELSGLAPDKQMEALSDMKEKGGLSIEDVKSKKAPKDIPPVRSPAAVDFEDLSGKEKAQAALEFMEGQRFKLFSPGTDTRVFDFIISVLEDYIN